MGRPPKRKRALGPYRHIHRWRAITIDPSEGAGAAGTRTYYFDARDEAELFVDEYNRGAAFQLLTVAEALEKYETEQLVNRRNKLRSWLETRRRIERLIGDVTMVINAITPRRAREMYAALVATGVSDDTHRGCLTHAKTFTAWARKAGITDQDPFRDVEPVGKKRAGKPKLRRDEARQLAEGAFRLLATCTDRVRWERYLLALTALYMGPRAGEIVARQVRDIDDDCSLYVIPDSKTQAGVRTEEIPDELRPWYRLLVKDRPRDAPLFPGRYYKRGRHHAYAYVTRECVAPLCAELGLPRVTAHGLRGTFADLATEAGAASRAVSESLGHAGQGVTARHYVGRQAAGRGKARRALKVLQGGKEDE